MAGVPTTSSSWPDRRASSTPKAVSHAAATELPASRARARKLAAKPASTKIKARALKKLKDAAA